MIYFSIADFAGIMRDIDAAKGRTCGVCMYGYTLKSGGAQQCAHGMAPEGPTDGCDKWRLSDYRAGQIARQRAPDEADKAI